VQKGQIYKRAGSWLLRYYDSVLENGEKKRVRKAVVLAPVSRDYPTKTSVHKLAAHVLTPINANHVAASFTPVTDFIEIHYLPHAQKTLRASTYKDYSKDIYRKHLKARLGGLRLRDFRTVHAQQILREIPDIGHATRLRIKSFLSGVFKHALREGFLDGHNPVSDASAPGRPAKFKGPTYSLDEIATILNVIKKRDKKAFAVIAVAAFAGLRLAELRGLRWSDFDGQRLTVNRTVWRTRVAGAKNEASATSVPVIPILKEILFEHVVNFYGQNETVPQRYMFEGERWASLNLANLANRVIKPALAAEGLQWKGWHAFRRSLSTNLYALGVSPKVIQAILRHGDVSTTLAFYVLPPEAESRAALERLHEKMGTSLSHVYVSS